MSKEEKVHIFNLTARRIGIAAKQNQDELFVLPPFGERTLKSDEQVKFDYERWRELNLIKVEFEKKEETESSVSSEVLSAAFGFIIIVLVVATFVRILGFWFGFFATPYFWIYVLAVIIAILVIAYREKVIEKLTNGWKIIKNWSTDIKHWVESSFSLLLVLAIGIGLPALIIYFFGDVKILLNTEPFTPSITFLGRGLQWFFIAIASLLPALMYFRFTHQKLGTVKENFFRDIVQLDPKVITLDDAKSMYGNKFESVYGTEKSSSMRAIYGARLPVFIATLVITVGWIFTLSPFGKVDQSVDMFKNFFTPAPASLVFAFLGAYFFGLNMLFRRYARADLRPKAYSHITVRIFTVIILVWVLSVIPWINKDEVLLPMAFIIGIFPETAVALIQEYLRTFKWFRGILQIKEENFLRNLDGINLYHRAQLLEEGIENTENLAHHDLIDLMLQTRIPVSNIVDWVDQAILHLHLEVECKEEEEKCLLSLKTLRNYGVRTATDLEQAYVAAQKRGQVDALLMELERVQHDSKVRRFQVIVDTIRDDEWMAYIRHWRDTSQFTNRIFTIDELKDELYPISEAVRSAPASENSRLSSTPAA